MFPGYPYAWIYIDLSKTLQAPLNPSWDELSSYSDTIIQGFLQYQYIGIYIVGRAQIACDIDIRTLTSNQVLGQILDQIFGQVLGQILDQVLDQGFWTRKDSVQFYQDRKRLHANQYRILRAYPTKTGYPLSTNDITKRYLFVNDNKYLTIPDILAWIAEFRPGNKTIYAVFCVESEK